MKTYRMKATAKALEIKTVTETSGGNELRLDFVDSNEPKIVPATWYKSFDCAWKPAYYVICAEGSERIFPKEAFESIYELTN